MSLARNQKSTPKSPKALNKKLNTRTLKTPKPEKPNTPEHVNPHNTYEPPLPFYIAPLKEPSKEPWTKALLEEAKARDPLRNRLDIARVWSWSAMPSPGVYSKGARVCLFFI